MRWINILNIFEFTIEFTITQASAYFISCHSELSILLAVIAFRVLKMRNITCNFSL